MNDLPTDGVAEVWAPRLTMDRAVQRTQARLMVLYLKRREKHQNVPEDVVDPPEALDPSLHCDLQIVLQIQQVSQEHWIEGGRSMNSMMAKRMLLWKLFHLTMRDRMKSNQEPTESASIREVESRPLLLQ